MMRMSSTRAFQRFQVGVPYHRCGWKSKYLPTHLVVVRNTSDSGVFNISTHYVGDTRH
ncbi:hypothetical protein BH09CHL1_BH09CHL1_19820 [soil metagenome]